MKHETLDPPPENPFPWQIRQEANAWIRAAGNFDAVVDFDAIAEEGTISRKDLELFRWCETAEEAWEHISAFYKLDR